MQIELFDGLPHAELAPRMRSLLAVAQRIDAAIAFVTRRGTAVLRELLEQTNPPRVRLVASVRFPTNLDELQRLEHRLPGHVWIHTGYQEPLEERADRGQFHSKIVLAELDGDERIIVVGSHNWTENALCGHNLEAGVILRCHEQDDVVQKARQHIEACIAESQPFDPNEMRFYQTVPALPISNSTYRFGSST
jgi:HKD family nuclease